MSKLSKWKKVIILNALVLLVIFGVLELTARSFGFDKGHYTLANRDWDLYLVFENHKLDEIQLIHHDTECSLKDASVHHMYLSILLNNKYGAPSFQDSDSWIEKGGDDSKRIYMNDYLWYRDKSALAYSIMKYRNGGIVASLTYTSEFRLSLSGKDEIEREIL